MKELITVDIEGISGITIYIGVGLFWSLYCQYYGECPRCSVGLAKHGPLCEPGCFFIEIYDMLITWCSLLRTTPVPNWC